MRRLLAAAAAGGLILVGLTILRPAEACAGVGTINENRAWGLINGTRAGRCLSVASWDSTLAACAHEHAKQMAAAEDTFHSMSGCDDRTSYELGGQGASPYRVHEGFLGSSSHRAVIVDANMRHVGTGVAHSGDTYYVVYLFSR